MLPLAFVVMFLQSAFQSGVPSKLVAPHPTLDSVIATVDGVSIKASDAEDLLWQWRGSEVTEELIEFQIVKAEADRRKVTTTQAELEARLAEEYKTAQLTSQGQDVDAQMKAQGFTRSRAYLRVQRQVLLEKMASSNFDSKDFVKVSVITFKPDANLSLEQALGKADAAFKQLQKGDSWKTVLASSTDSAAVVESQGALGWRKTKIFPEGVVTEMRSLPVGKYTKPAQTTAGVQIFRLDAKGWELKSEDLKQLQNLYIQTAITQLDNELRKAAKITRKSQ